MQEVGELHYATNDNLVVIALVVSVLGYGTNERTMAGAGVVLLGGELSIDRGESLAGCTPPPPRSE